MSNPKVKRVLVSVTDKSGVADFARALVDEFGAEIISTGGTARALKDAGVPVTPIDDVTQFPEMMDGRVKTLHPRVHGGLLAKRDNEAHMAQAAEHGIEMIDMVVVNLYAFEKTVESGADFDVEVTVKFLWQSCLPHNQSSGRLPALFRSEYDSHARLPDSHVFFSLQYPDD